MVRFKISTILVLFVFASSFCFEDPDMEEFRHEFSDSTFMAFNNESKEYKPFELAQVEPLQWLSKWNIFKRWDQRMIEPYKRDWDVLQASIGQFIVRPSWAQMAKSCITYQNTYRNAFRELRKYYDIRQLYHKVLHYEVGYLTHEIVYRYIIVLEMYQWIEKRFISDPDHWTSKMAPTPYMFYVYTLILEMCKAIIHLSNMLQVIEDKYDKERRGPFDDYEMRHQMLDKLKGTTLFPLSSVELRKEILKQAYEKNERRKKKMQRLRIKLMLQFGLLTTPSTPKRTGRWEKIYGWSVEEAYPLPQPEWTG